MFNVAARIKELREVKGITVNKLATLSGLSQGFVRQIELGEKKPTVESLSYLCDTLEISLSDFFRDSAPDLPVDRIHLALSRLSEEQLNALLTFVESLV